MKSEKYGGDVDEETETLIVYRQNELYDSIREGVETEMGENGCSSIVIPEGTEELSAEDREEIAQYLEEADRNDVYVTMDSTTASMLEKSEEIESHFDSVESTYDRSMGSLIQEVFEDNGGLNAFNKSLEGVAEIGKEQNMDSLVVVLSDLECNSTIADHEVYIERDGEEVVYVSSDGTASWSDGEREELKGNASGYEEVFDFIREKFEDRGYNVYPAVAEKFGEEVEIAEDFEGLNFDYSGSPTSVEETAEIEKENAVLLTDRHIVPKVEFGRTFKKQDGPLIEDASTGEYTAVRCNDETVVEEVVEMIKNEETPGSTRDLEGLEGLVS